MYTLLVIIHVLNSMLLVTVILMQRGRGGGLTENFASAESVFGAQTSGVMIRITSVLGALFIGTSLLLTFMSVHKERSLMESKPDIIKKTLGSTNMQLNKVLDETKAAVETKAEVLKVLADEKPDSKTPLIPASNVAP